MSDTVQYLDDSLPIKLTNIPTVEETDEFVLGQRCKKISFYSAANEYTYFFSNKYGLSPYDYQFQKHDGYDKYVRIAKAVPLKMIYKTKIFTIESTAEDIRAGRVSTENFVVPNGPFTKLILPTY